jgi:hypothetical protein
VHTRIGISRRTWAILAVVGSLSLSCCPEYVAELPDQANWGWRDQSIGDGSLTIDGDTLIISYETPDGETVEVEYEIESRSTADSA